MHTNTKRHGTLAIYSFAVKNGHELYFSTKQRVKARAWFGRWRRWRTFCTAGRNGRRPLCAPVYLVAELQSPMRSHYRRREAAVRLGPTSPRSNVRCCRAVPPSTTDSMYASTPDRAFGARALTTALVHVQIVSLSSISLSASHYATVHLTMNCSGLPPQPAVNVPRDHTPACRRAPSEDHIWHSHTAL